MVVFPPLFGTALPYPDGDPENKDQKRKADWASAVREAAPFLTIGSAFAVNVFLGLILGLWLDRRVGTQPIMTLVGAFLGLAAGFYHFVRAVRRGRL
jgi:ATP synthase protein I